VGSAEPDTPTGAEVAPDVAGVVGGLGLVIGSLTVGDVGAVPDLVGEALGVPVGAGVTLGLGVGLFDGDGLFEGVGAGDALVVFAVRLRIDRVVAVPATTWLPRSQCRD
jgi:hypothetical protein